MILNPFNTKIGLALGGGGAKGIAHIGVIRALMDEDIKVAAVAGTSVGAIVSSYFAFGQALEKINDLGDRLKMKDVLRLSFSKRGFLSTDAIRKMILKDIGEVNIEDASIPLAITATDIHDGSAIVFRKGPLAPAVCASIAVPGVFVPCEINGRLLVDGGLTQNVPIDALDDFNIGIKVAVNLNAVQDYPEADSMIDIVGNAIDIAIDRRTQDQMEKADLPIALDLSRYSRLDNSKVKEELIQIGYDETRKHVRKLVWYRKANLYFYLKKLISEVIPLKVPRFLKRWFS